MTSMELQLSRYYKRKGISPEDFRCPHQVCCESYCTSGNFQTPNEGVRVSDFYQDRAYLNHHIPCIVVISLSAPVPRRKRDGNNGPLNKHWRMTLAMVRSLLNDFLEEDLPERAIRIEDNSTRQVEKLFVHLRTAKCSSQQEQEDSHLYENCGHYLGGELRILKPNVIITQGFYARDQLEKHLLRKKIVKNAGRLHIHAVTLDDERKACWIPTIHPCVFNDSYSLQVGPPVDSERDMPESAMRTNLLECGRFIKCIHEFL